MGKGQRTQKNKGDNALWVGHSHDQNKRAILADTKQGNYFRDPLPCLLAGLVMVLSIFSDVSVSAPIALSLLSRFVHSLACLLDTVFVYKLRTWLLRFAFVGSKSSPFLPFFPSASFPATKFNMLQIDTPTATKSAFC